MATTRVETRTYTITETTVTTGRRSRIDITLDDKRVSIDVPAELKAYFDDQFSRPNPTPLQRRKYSTLMGLMRAAYLQGLKDQ